MTRHNSVETGSLRLQTKQTYINLRVRLCSAPSLYSVTYIFSGTTQSKHTPPPPSLSGPSPLAPLPQLFWPPLLGRRSIHWTRREHSPELSPWPLHFLLTPEEPPSWSGTALQEQRKESQVNIIIMHTCLHFIINVSANSWSSKCRREQTWSTSLCQRLTTCLTWNTLDLHKLNQ